MKRKKILLLKSDRREGEELKRERKEEGDMVVVGVVELRKENVTSKRKILMLREKSSGIALNRGL